MKKLPRRLGEFILKRFKWYKKHGGGVSYPLDDFEANQSLRDRVVLTRLGAAVTNVRNKRSEASALHVMMDSLIDRIHKDRLNEHLKQQLKEASLKFLEAREATETALDAFTCEWKFYAKHPQCIDPKWGDSNHFLNTYEPPMKTHRAHQSILTRA